ncbi:hypothetical protein ACWGB8_17535 [Kitasatospora sp. NPDC054939]
MVSLFRRLDEEEAIVRGELDALREKLASAEERLARLTITRETALQLLGNQASEADLMPAPAPAAVAVPEAIWAPATVPSRSLDELEAKLAAITAQFDAQPSAPQAAAAAAPVERPAPPVAVSGRLEWAEGMERILGLLATAGRVMQAREIAVAIGEDTSSPARVETTRGRCKRLVKEGKVIEVEAGHFRIATQYSSVAMAGGEAPGAR